MKVDAGGASHIGPGARKDKVVQRRAAVVPDIELLQRRPPGDQEFAFRTEVVACINILPSNVGAIDESSCCDESWAVVSIDGLQVEVAASPFGNDFVLRARRRGTRRSQKSTWGR